MRIGRSPKPGSVLAAAWDGSGRESFWSDDLALASAPCLAFTQRPRTRKRSAMERGLALYAAIRSFRAPSLKLCFGVPGVGPSEVSCRVRFHDTSPSLLVRWRVRF
ncbi:MAG: hypothetical protein R3E97_00640 [Candidatus Eisenbacteria bacterium]